MSSSLECQIFLINKKSKNCNYILNQKIDIRSFLESMANLLSFFNKEYTKLYNSDRFRKIKNPVCLTRSNTTAFHQATTFKCNLSMKKPAK